HQQAARAAAFRQRAEYPLELGRGDDGLSAGVGENVFHLGRRVQRRERHGDPTGAPDPPLRGDEAAAWRREEGDGGLIQIRSFVGVIPVQMSAQVINGAQEFGSSSGRMPSFKIAVQVYSWGVSATGPENLRIVERRTDASAIAERVAKSRCAAQISRI